MDELMKWVLSGGLLGAIGTVIGIVANRRKIKSEAAARDLKTPAEVEHLAAVTEDTQMGIALSLNKSLAAENGRLGSRLEGIDEQIDDLRRRQEATTDDLRVVQRGLASAYAYITTLLSIIREHIPHVSIPPYPEGYTPPKD